MDEYDERIADCQDLPTLLLSNLRKFADQIFLIDGLNDIKYTFSEVHDEAVLYAKILLEKGVKAGSYVALLSDSTIDVYIFKIAVWLAGGCVCPVNAHLISDELYQVLEISTANVMFCGGNHIATFEKIKSSLSNSIYLITDKKHDKYDSLEEWREKRKISIDDIYGFSTEPFDPFDHIIYQLFTSGTTGVPKGVLLSSYASLLNGCRVYSQRGPTLNTSPLYWISNSAAFINSLLEGSELIFPGVKIVPDTHREDPYHILECIEKYKPQKWGPLASLAMELCYLPDIKKYDLSCLTHISIGGTVLLPRQKKFICDTLFNGRNILQERFGTTEVGFLTRQWSFSPPSFDDPKAASFGPPPQGVELKIVDIDTREKLGPNQPGEIVVRSNCIMKRYINKELVDEYTSNDWFPLGDIGYYDDDGWFYYKTRVKELIKYRGYQLSPADLEILIMKHPDVLEVCVIGKPHPIDCEHPAAFVIKKDNSSLTESEVISYVAERVNDSRKLRGGVIFKTTFPRSGTGKILRRKLKEELEDTTSF